MELAGKKAVVFGGTSGIGLATCKLLLDLQAQVVAISREPNKACELQGAELVACDVRDRNTLERVFAEQAPFDILISAATGGDRAIGPFMQMELDAYQASFDKLWGYTNVVQIGVPYLNAARQRDAQDQGKLPWRLLVQLWSSLVERSRARSHRSGSMWWLLELFLPLCTETKKRLSSNY